jgi:hypothetical protein
MHMIEMVMHQTFRYDKEHHSLQNKNDLKASADDRRVAAPRTSPHRAT